MWGLEIYSETGQKIVDSDNFGISFYDEIVISATDSGSKTYPELGWFNQLWAIQTQIIAGSYSANYRPKSWSDDKQRMTYHIPKINEFNTTQLSGEILAGNIPKITWAQGTSVSGGAHDILIKVLVT